MNEILEAILGMLLELALKGPGYLIARCVYAQESIERDGCLVVVLGICFCLTIWGIVLLL
jgi:hypothetical protein